MTAEERGQGAAARASGRPHSSAVVVQRVARLPFPAGDGGSNPTLRLQLATAAEVAPLLSAEHYLGPASGRFVFAGWVADELVAAQIWRHPTARMLAGDGWLELSRWCLTPDAGKNAGSKMMGYVRRWLRRNAPDVRRLVSYSDPVHGHTGALYKASGWTYSPTHHALRWEANGVGYPSGHGSWDGVTRQSPKQRWVIEL